MRKGNRCLAADVFGTTLIAACVASASPVAPNGLFTVNVAGPNLVGTVSGTNNIGNIVGGAELTLTGDETIGSFEDPFQGEPNNFCGANTPAALGCTAAHAPGFLVTGDRFTEFEPSYPIEFGPAAGGLVVA